MEEGFTIKLLAVGAVIALLISNLAESPAPLVIYTAFATLVVLAGRLEKSKQQLEEQRTELIRTSHELDEQLSDELGDSVDSAWVKKASEVPTPTLSPDNHTLVENHIQEVSDQIDIRKAALDNLENLRKYHQRVSIALETELPEIESDAIIKNLQPDDAKQPADDAKLSIAHSLLACEEAIITTYAFEFIQQESENPTEIDVGLLTDPETKPHTAYFSQSDIEAIGDSLFKLLAINQHEPRIDPSDAVRELDLAINEDGDLSSAHAQFTLLYTLMCRVQTIEEMQTEIELAYTSIDQEDITTAITTAIDKGDPGELDGIYNRLKQAIESTWDVSDLRGLSWQEFEDLVADLWETKGYKTEVTTGGADSGIDVRAEKNNIWDSLIIQAKHHKTGNKVGRPTVQKTLGSLTTDTGKSAVVVTSASFTQPAITESRKAGDTMELVDGDSLIRMLSQSSIAPPTDGNTKQQQKWKKKSFEPQNVVIEALTEPEILSKEGMESPTEQTEETEDENEADEQDIDPLDEQDTDPAESEDAKADQTTENDVVEGATVETTPEETDTDTAEEEMGGDVGDEIEPKSEEEEMEALERHIYGEPEEEDTDTDSGPEHPFGDDNSGCTIDHSSVFGETCPICQTTDSIWKRHRDGSPSPQYKCGACETVWRRYADSGAVMWIAFEGPLFGEMHTVSEWKNLDPDEIDTHSPESKDGIVLEIQYHGQWYCVLGNSPMGKEIFGEGPNIISFKRDVERANAYVSKDDGSSEEMMVRIWENGSIVDEASTIGISGSAEVEY